MLVCLLLVSVRRAIIVRNSESVLDLLAIRCTIYETSPIGMVTTPARTVKNNYTAMLVAKGKQKLPPGTLLLRFVDATGTSIKFVIFGSAISQFSGCKLLRIYDVEIPNKCVRMSGDVQPHGVKHNSHRVDARYYETTERSKARSTDSNNGIAHERQTRRDN